MNLEEQYDKIYRYCYFKLGSRQQAEDITQETFLHFLESSTYEDMGQPLRYLYTIARNLCMDSYRRKKEEPMEEAVSGLMEAQEERIVTAAVIRQALLKLSEEERELVLLRYVNEVPVVVIGKLFGISRFAVFRKTKKALAFLKKELEHL